MTSAWIRLAVVIGCGLGWGMAADASACSISCALSFASGPVSWWEVAAVVPVVGVVPLVFVQAFRYTLRPGEQASDHIKWRILQEDEERP